MNVSEQHLTQRLANRLQKRIKRILNYNQVFIPSMQGWFNKRKPKIQFSTLIAQKKKKRKFT